MIYRVRGKGEINTTTSAPTS